MDPNVMLKQMLTFNKSAFDNTFSAMRTLQEQNEKMMLAFMEQAHWIPEEGKKLIHEWLNVYRQGSDNFKRLADENYQRVANYFDMPPQAESR